MKHLIKTMAFTLLGLVLSVNLMAGDDVVTFYYETFGKNETGKTVAWSDADSYLSDSNTKKYCESTGWAGISKSTSVACDVEGSSGNSHIFAQTADKKFVLVFGDISKYSNVTLTLNWKNGASTKGNRTLTIKPSANGGTSFGNDLIGTNKSQAWQTLTYNVPEASLKNFAIEFTCTSSNECRIDDIKLTGIEAGGDDCTTEVEVRKTNNIQNGDITISAESVCADDDGGSVTVTPSPAAHYHCTGVTATVGSVTGPVEGVYTVSGITAETTISATFAEDDFATISWSVNGNSATGGSTKVYVGEKVSTLPTAPTSIDCDGSKVFVGWTNATTDGAKPAVLFTKAADAPPITSTGAVTYYAVFASVDEDGSETADVTMSYSGSTTGNMDGTNQADLFGLSTEKWSAIGNKNSASNNVGYNKNDKDIRLYGATNGTGCRLAISSLDNTTIESVELTLTEDYANVQVWVNNELVSLSENKYPVNSTSFELGNANDGTGTTQVRIKSIKINYLVAGYSDYVTTCTEVEKYTITAAVNDAAMGSATVQGQASFDAVDGAELALLATPNDGYKFVNWTVNSEDYYIEDEEAASTTLLVGETALTVTANFVAKATYTITWLVNGNAAQGSPTTSVLEGEAITALPTTPTSEDCFSLKDFVGWTAIANYSNATDAPSDLFTTADKAPAITANTTFYAVFAAATGAPTFNLTAAGDMVAGVYAIGAICSETEPSDNYYFADGTIATSSSNKDANVTTNYAEATDGVITSLPEGAVEFTFAGDNTNGFTISFVDGNTTKYLGYTSSTDSRRLAYGDYSSITWKVEAKENPLNEGGITLYNQSGSYRISENATTTSAIRGYKNGSTYRALYLFKKGKGSYGNYSVTCEAPSVENPVFTTDATKPYVTSVKVELSCETEDATIYYNIDSDSDPTSESEVYNPENGIVLNTNGEHTIRAIAIKDEDESQVISATYTVLVPYTTAAALQSVVTTTETTVAVIFNDWIVTGTTTKNAYIVDGNNNGVLVFTDGHGFAVNDHVSGTVITTLVKYNGACELKGVKASDFTTVEQGAAATPVEFTDFSQLTSAYQSAVVTLKNAKFNSSKLEDANGVKITPFTTFYSGAVNTLVYNASYDYTGIVVMFNNVEVCPRNAEDIVKLAEKTSATVAWYTDDTQTTPLTSAKVSDNETFSAFLYTNNAEGMKTYSSSNTDVAEISTEGAITIKGIGQTTIKCVVGESTLYYENYASFTLQVKAAGSDDVTWVAEEQGYENGTALGEVLENPVTITFAKAEGSNDPKYYTNTKGNAARFYQSNTLTITAPEGQMINSVVITYISDNKNAISANTGSITTEGLIDTWIGMTKNVVFTAASDASASWIYSLKITYMTGIEVTLSVEDINMQVTDEPKTIVYNCVGKENPTITYSDYDEDVISIAEGKVTAKKAGSTEVTAKIAQEGQYSSAEAKFTVTVTEKTPVTLSFEQESYTAKLGETFETPTLTKSAEVDVTYSSSNTEVAEVNETTGAINHKKQGTTTITASFVGDATYEPAQATYELKVVDPNIDILTADLIGVTTYTEWSGKTDATGTVYAGFSTKGSSGNAGAIQMNTTNNSGIISTHAIGYLKGVSVDFKTTPGSGKSLQVYAKNTAYESASDLYDSNKQGTLIGSFTESGDIVLETGISFDDNYRYIGVRSSSGAMYLNNISIKWEPVEFGPDFTLEDKAAGAFATICLPRKIDHVENATLYSISYGNTSAIEFVEAEEYVAGMPYLVQVAEEGDVNFYYIESDDAVDAPVSAELAKGFVGSLQEDNQEVPSDGSAILISGGQLHIAGEWCVLTKNHAYIDANNLPTEPALVAGAPRRTIRLYNPDAQAPTNLNGLNGNMKATKVLRDGQLYIICDTKTYNAQGIEVQ